MSARGIAQLMRQWSDESWCKAFGINDADQPGAFRLVDDCAHAANEIERFERELAEARAILQSIVELNPDAPAVRYHRARIDAFLTASEGE